MTSGEWWQCSGMLQFVQTDDILNLVECLMPDRWQRYHVLKLGGDCVEARCEEPQELHYDGCFPMDLQYWFNHDTGIWEMYGHDYCPALGISVAPHVIHVDQGPLRITSWDRHAQWAENNGCTPPSLMDERRGAVDTFRVAMPAGWVVLRDLRLYHAGSANSLNTDRFLPGVVIGSVGLMAAGQQDDDFYQPSYRPTRSLPPTVWEALQSTRLASHLDYMYCY